MRSILLRIIRSIKILIILISVREMEALRNHIDLNLFQRTHKKKNA